MSVFIPHKECTNASGGCFSAGACIFDCRKPRQIDPQSRVAQLKRELAEAREKTEAADLCLQAVTAARKTIREQLGGNCACLDDDLTRWVLHATESLMSERDAALARLEEIYNAPTHGVGVSRGLDLIERPRRPE